METIHDQMREKVALAFTYAEDGAPGSAARLFQEVAAEYQSRADEIANMVLAPFKAFNAQFPKGVECATLEGARTYLVGWCAAWVEDKAGRVVYGQRPDNWPKES